MPELTEDCFADLGIRRVAGPANMAVVDIDDDSRMIQPGWCFVARQGHRDDGHRYVEDALQRGAVAILSEQPMAEVRADVMLLECDDVRTVGPKFAERIHGNPSQHITTVGITGTNGKTTVSYLMRQLLEAAGRRTGLIGTIEIDDGRNRQPAKLTTPSAYTLSRTLRRMVDHGCQAVAMELSSHALDQDRAAGLQLDVGIFTNLSGDHLDYHKDMQSYARAKKKMFDALSAKAHAAVNLGDDHGPFMVQDTPAKVTGFAIIEDAKAATDATVSARWLNGHGSSMRAEVHGPWGRREIDISLIGRHNLENVTACLAAMQAMGLTDDAVFGACAKLAAAPGRLEQVSSDADDIVVIVDYAHTDDALDNVLNALGDLSKRRMIVVFGAGGDRDATKRPRMAAVASHHADVLWITSDNPRTEDPQKILDEIASGVDHDAIQAVYQQGDRALAIADAIMQADPGDMILIAGKGHEDYQIIGERRIAFDDRQQARKALHRRASQNRER